MVTLSIITPTFNRYETLVRTIRSVSEQTFTSLEHIIIDNMSNDGTEELIKKYISKANYPVAYIREKDTGIYNAMNKGIKKAKGEWIHILNSDDYFASNDVLEKVFFRDYLSQYDIITNQIIQKNTKTGKETVWIPEYIEEEGFYRFPHPGTIIRSSIYSKYGLYDERYRIISDSVFGAKIYNRCRFLIIQEPLVIMSMGGVSSSKSFLKMKEEMILNVFYRKASLYRKIGYIRKYVFDSLSLIKRQYLMKK